MNEAEQIIETARAMALKMFPEQILEREVYCGRLLETKLRELLYRAPALTVRDTMPEAREAAMTAAQAIGQEIDGWIPWEAGIETEGPLPPRAMVEVQVQSGNGDIEFIEGPASTFWWARCAFNVVAYRVLP